MRQLDLVTVQREVQLTERQAHALSVLQARGTDGMQAGELGAAMHEHAGKHPADVCCDWCVSTGHALLVALRKKGMACQRGKNGRRVWQAVGVAAKPDASFGEFPEGF